MAEACTIASLGQLAWAADGDVALVVEQPVKDMQGFACRLLPGSSP